MVDTIRLDKLFQDTQEICSHVVMFIPLRISISCIEKKLSIPTISLLMFYNQDYVYISRPSKALLDRTAQKGLQLSNSRSPINSTTQIQETSRQKKVS